MTALRHDAGYSLMELLVVLLLLSFITLAVAGGFRFGTRVWETTDRAVVDQRHVVSLQTVLRSLLASAVPKTKGGYIVFDGSPTTLSFYAPAPRAMGTGGLVRTEITFERGGDRVAIALAPARGEIRRAAFETSTTLLRLAYLDASDRTPIWLDRWHDRKSLPAAVRIEGTTDDARAHWPAFVVKLHIDQTPLCVFDPVSLDCRGA
jgi:prepilin-type N-terminal cleavage/methylation domain-containing protein